MWIRVARASGLPRLMPSSILLSVAAWSTCTEMLNPCKRKVCHLRCHLLLQDGGLHKHDSNITAMLPCQGHGPGNSSHTLHMHVMSTMGLKSKGGSPT